MTVPAGQPLTAAIRPVTTRQVAGRRGAVDASVGEAVGDDRLWAYYDGIGEIHYWLETQSSIAQVLNYFPGVDVDDTDIVDPERDQDPTVRDTWDEVGGEEFFRATVGELSVHRKVTGKAYLVALDDKGKPVPAVDETGMPRVDDETPEVDRWDVMSSGEYRSAIGQGAKPEEYAAWKIWARHPRDARHADTPLKVLARQCETLMLLESRMLADARSRLFAGVTLFPDVLKNAVTDDGVPWDQMLEEAFLEPITDPDSVASVVPVWGYIPAELLGKSQTITFGRENITEAIAQRAELIRRIAAGLDAPAEYLLGMGDLNHWTAWLVNDDAFERHVGPDVREILADLTTWWQALLRARGMQDVERRVIAMDPTPALRRADQLADTTKVYDRYAASAEALRRAAGLDDTDAPDDDEIARRIAIDQARRGVRASVPAEDEPTPQTGPPDSPNPADGDPPPEQAARRPAPAPAPRPAIIVAATDDRTEQIAADLTRLDRATLAAMEVETERQIASVVEAAREAIVNRANGTTYEALEPGEIINLVGPDGGIDPDLFDAAAIAALIAAAEDERITTLTGSELLPDDVPRMSDEESNTAVAAIIAALAAAATAAVLKSRPDPDQPRETTGRITEPPVRQIRQALTVAGGATRAQAETPSDADMIGNGQRTIDTLAAAGLITTGYRWVYGDIARRTFRPHASIDGQRFDDFDDPVLIPPPDAAFVGPRMYPGDHKGCRCTFRRVLEVAAPPAA